MIRTKPRQTGIAIHITLLSPKTYHPSILITNGSPAPYPAFYSLEVTPPVRGVRLSPGHQGSVALNMCIFICSESAKSPGTKCQLVSCRRNAKESMAAVDERTNSSVILGTSTPFATGVAERICDEREPSLGQGLIDHSLVWRRAIPKGMVNLRERPHRTWYPCTLYILWSGNAIMSAVVLQVIVLVAHSRCAPYKM